LATTRNRRGIIVAVEGTRERHHLVSGEYTDSDGTPETVLWEREHGRK